MRIIPIQWAAALKPQSAGESPDQARASIALISVRSIGRGLAYVAAGVNPRFFGGTNWERPAEHGL